MQQLCKEFRYAAQKGDVETIEKMLKEGSVTVDCVEDPDDPSALYYACNHEHLDVVRALIRAGANVNSCNSFTRSTPLHAACNSGNSVEIVQELLEAGAEVDMVDSYGRTALLLLTYRIFKGRKADIARLLLAAHCNINAKAKNDETALLSICTHTEMNDLFFTLVQAGADLMATTRDHGRNVLHLCAAEKETDSLHKIEILLGHVMDLHARDKNGKTALHLAVKAGNLALTRMLLEKGADVFIQDNRGRTALMEAASLRYNSAMITDEDQLLLVRCLLSQCNLAKSCDRLINLQDNDGLTVLHYAVFERSQKLVHEILDWQPEVTTRMYYTSFTALHLAIYKQCNSDLDVLKWMSEFEMTVDTRLFTWLQIMVHRHRQ